MENDEFLIALTKTPGYSQVFGGHSKDMETYFKEPRLKTLIWEATIDCNLHCLHCVNPREDWKEEDELTTDEAKRIFREVAEDFDPGELHLAITGGECTLRDDLVEMVRYLKGLGFRNVSCDSNGWLYGDDLSLIDELYQAGMGSSTLSIDGLEAGHDRMRGKRGSYERAMRVLGYLLEHYPDKNHSVISVVTKFNLHEIPEAMRIFEEKGCRFGRLSPVVPAGRAVNFPELFLEPSEFKQVMDWLVEWRIKEMTKEHSMHYEFIDDGWCGRYHEGVVRPWLFRCDTGVTVGTVTWNGKAAACPIIHRELTEQGDLRKERFSTIWSREFARFRNREWMRTGECEECGDWCFCHGGSLHNRNPDGSMNPCPKSRLEPYIKELERLTMVQKD